MPAPAESPDGFQIDGDVVAFRAVAARDAEREFAMAIMHADGHAVHLGLDDVLDLFAAQMLADRLVERAEFGQRVFVPGAIAFLAVGLLGAGRMVSRRHLVQRQHRHQMADPGEFLAGRAADPLRGRFRRYEVGKLPLQLL